MGVEYSPYNSCNCNCNLYHHGVGGPSSRKAKNTWHPLGCCERVAYNIFRSFFIMKTQILQDKNGLVRHINGLALEIKELIEPIFHLVCNRGSHINKMVTEVSNLCGAVSSSSRNGMQCWVVKCMLFICRCIGSNHFWNLIWSYFHTIVSFSPVEVGLFLVHTWLNFSWFIFLIICCVRQHRCHFEIL